MDFNVIILKRADLEIEEAYLYYESIQKHLGEKLILDYENHLKTLYKIPFFEKSIMILEYYP